MKLAWFSLANNFKSTSVEYFFILTLEKVKRKSSKAGFIKFNKPL